jgi:DnaK suppressor protein
MDKHQADPYRQQLQSLRTALLAQIAQQRGGVVSRADAAVAHFERPEDSRAQVATERETEFALAEHETLELNALEAALKRIDDGKYGVCTDCGTDIATPRLHAAPEAPRCIQCQEKFERQHPT